MNPHKARKVLEQRPDPPDPGYEVGYAKPPVHSRFTPGQSGNPKGRPRGSRNRPDLPASNEDRLKRVILEEAYRTIGVRDGERSIDMPMIRAVIRSVAVNAAKGHQRAQRMFVDIVRTVERENRALHDELLETTIQYKTDWEIELYYRKKRGIDLPDPVPHPDDIFVDMRRGTVEIRGPMTPEDKPEWERIRGLARQYDEEIAELEKQLKDDPDNKSIRLDLAYSRRVRAIIEGSKNTMILRGFETFADRKK